MNHPFTSAIATANPSPNSHGHRGLFEWRFYSPVAVGEFISFGYMSDSWINIIPKEPRFVPSAEAQKRALEYMQRIVGSADEVTSQITEEIRFIDCGENLESIGCPQCKREIPTEWWQDQMEYQYNHGYSLEPVRLPCCRASESLARLDYSWPQGYARFSVGAMNPRVADLTDGQINEFEKILGCAVIKVLQHI